MTRARLLRRASSPAPPVVTNVERPGVTSHDRNTQTVPGDGFARDFSGVRVRTSRPRVQCAPPGIADPSLGTRLPGWTPGQLRSIQRQLKRLGLYRARAHGLFGQDTESGLIEAFGGDEWRELNPREIVARLARATPSRGRSGEHGLHYGELFKDGILDITLGVGFDESGWGRIVYREIGKRLPNLGFEENAARAKKIYERTGHTPGASAFGMYFVLKDCLKYRPPTGVERKVDVVVRLVGNPNEKHGKEAASAFKEGMEHSDIAFYSGHARFGSGPDFDRAMKVTFLSADEHTVEAEFSDYEQVEAQLRKEVKSSDVGSLWRRFQWRLSHKRIKVQGENEGNIYINPTNKHPGEFLARLMYWNLNRKGTFGARVATGRKGELARAATERRYRIWVFNGCRTQDYVRSVRTTPGAGARSTDVVATRRSIYWNDHVNTVLAFLKAILDQQSAEQVVKEMDATNVTSRRKGKAGVADIPFGLKDNPTIP